jgi:glucose/arabinose dehydrogenase
VRTKYVAPLAVLLSISAGVAIVVGQRTVPFANGIPVAPSGLANKPLGAGPFLYDTGEGQKIRVVVTKGLSYPFSMTWLPDGTVLVTERMGKLRIIRNGKLDPQPVAGVPMNYGAGESGLPGAVHGLMDIVLHPQYAQNRYLYINYTKQLDAKRNTVAIARASWDASGLKNVKDIFVASLGTSTAPGTSTSRMVFGKDGMLYLATSGADPQDPNSHGGKVLRLKDDGSAPPDNPFVGKPGYKPEIYTMGHRSSLGLAVHPRTGQLWQTENGPNGGDEINILKPGANYGWPMVSYGRQYTGPFQSERPSHEGFEPPVVIWVPAIATSGLTFYTGDKLPAWNGDVFVGGLRTGEIPGTGHIERILFNEKMEELRRESLLGDLRQRMRDIRQGPDGLLYVLTDEKDGALLRIEPAPAR